MNDQTERQPQIDETIRRKADVIALFMGGDYGMTVGVGPWGSGWHWDFVKNHVNMDAKDLATEPEDVVKGIAAHEGNHRLVSRAEHVTDLWQEPGFSFGFNACEDPRANQAGMSMRPGSRDWIRAYIERDLSPGGGLDYKGMLADARNSLGYVPKFMQWGGEIIHHWYKREFTDGLKTEEDKEHFLEEIPDEDVRRTIRETIDAFDEFYRITPTTKDEFDVQREAIASTEVFIEKIWPKYKQLVEESLKDQNMVNMIKDMLSQDQQGGGQGQHGGGQIMVIPFDALPKDVQDEIREKVKEANRQQGQKGPKQSGEPQGQERAEKDQEKQTGEDGQSGANGQTQQTQGEQSGDSSGSEQGMNVQEESAEPAEGTQGSSAQGREEDGRSENGSDMRIPWDDFSDKTKKAIEDAYDNLSSESKDSLEQRAREDLEDVEDEANEKLKGHINDPRHQESHKERRVGEKTSQAKEEQQKEAERVARDMEKRRKEALETIQEDPYQSVLSMPDVDAVRRRLEKEFKTLFEPTEEPSIRYSSTGLRPSMRKAMQMEADPRKYNAFEAKGRPTEKSYRFLLLVDLSPSMEGKIFETFKMVAAFSEVMNRFGLEFAIIGFRDSFKGKVRLYKDFGKKKLTNQDRDVLGKMLSDCGGSGTPTYEATQASYRYLKRRMSSLPLDNNYFITLTDGEPTSTSQEEVLDLLREVRSDRSVVTAGFGIGPGTDFVNDSYPELHERVKRDIARALGANFDEVGNSYTDAEEFGRAFAIIMEYMVKHPEFFYR
ncbi:hypothetical protein A2W70_04815 [Candidatus Curtissbacteria bacterium RIFCSPLOWO2_02_41_11]|uniref:VWFA domain-containing protein n=4 Tax=Candidatus Curtissiibacteriota TaxID=1752717 RepID=A0A1F5HRN1_9BACT|nr:MAG: hypothetical protein UU56_C0004G0018 [Candidatus Curtissbacteria bacterium GW2011_GWA2_41_24]OGE06743.1 MAG: hypothetical protein A2W70_04815 [Candidatus Curtissbacteria bacterium RIFCSPLOWO2_02_41_11]